MKRSDLDAPSAELFLDPQDFAKRCRITPDDSESRMKADSPMHDASQELTRSLLRYVRCGLYIDRSGVSADGDEDPVAPHEPEEGSSYRSLLERSLEARSQSD
mmetsp:Transcript_66828/g.156611  ORF Transcript_66828/g.156611 Transcript_66828/m.156611 type:complete len:103 (+) Transcript_66828:52-360(+)